ncbi:MAG: efflux RND transporter periplasmic adaptor subunit [Anaerolineae bacterium]|jgi:HlyD family secretion protein
MRRVLITLIVLVAMGTAGVWAYQNYFTQPEEPQEQRQEAPVERGTLLAMVNATGTILPEKQTTLSFKSPGRVAEVAVSEGQSVRSGQVLARLETDDLQFAIDQAELGLATAQAQLLRLQRPPSEHDIAAAQAALTSARASYQRLLAGPTNAEVRVARTNLDQAEAALAQAQLAYDQVADRPNVAMLPQSLQLQQATIAYEAAKASFELTMRDPSNAEVAAAHSAVVQAETALARLQEGVQEEEILLAQLQVEQAQIALDQALHQLVGTALLAPHDGTITLLGIRQGELSGGQPAFVLTDFSSYHIDVIVDEIDIGRVAVGQQVTITLDALPGETLAGQIEQIAETAQLDSGVVSYKVRVNLEPSDAPLRAGMTANVDIVTERREDVLLVPNRFITIDRLTGRTFVDHLVGQEIQAIEIQTGLRDETYSEVLAGLQEGDVVVLVQRSSRDQLREAFEMGPP